MTQLHPYCPYTSGSSIDYIVYKITGVYDPVTMDLDVRSRTQSPTNAFQTYTALRVPSPEPTVYLAGTLTGEPTPTLDSLKDPSAFPYLIDGVWQPAIGGKGWIGEANVLKPYEPKLTMNPVVGEKFNLNCAANTFVNGQVTQWTFDCTYSTIAHGAWGPWSDTYRTGLLENTAERQQWGAYNYIFAKGIGPVNYWKGAIDANNAIIDTPQNWSGYEWYAVAWRGQ